MFGNMKYPTLWKIAAVVVSHACFASAMAASVKPSAGKGYTVKSGDTFAKIARANHLPLSDLLRANHLSSADTVKPGQHITIPGSGNQVAKSTPEGKSPGKAAPSKKAAQAVVKNSSGKSSGTKERAGIPAAQVSSGSKAREKSTTVNITPPPQAGTYLVQSGDTLNRIQRRTGTPVASLMKLNNLSESSILRPGQKLRIKGSTAVAVAKNQPATVTKNQPAALATAHTAPRQPVTSRSQEPTQALTPPASPAPAAPVPAAPSTTAPHKVEAGETFSSIGRLYGLSQAKLTAANPGVNAAKLHPGMTLMIPGQPVRPGTQPVVVRADGRILANRTDPLAGGTPVSAPAERTRTGYLVEEGETLTQIAQRFHTTERDLRQLNHLGDSDNIYAGRYILVPFIRQAPPTGATLARRDA